MGYCSGTRADLCRPEPRERIGEASRFWHRVRVRDVQRVALLRFYHGESQDVICRDLAITPALLAEWVSTTPTSALRPRDLPYVSLKLEPILEGRQRTDLGLRVGPPDRLANGEMLVHVVAPRRETGPICSRCGRTFPTGVVEDGWAGESFLLLRETVPTGASSMRRINAEEAEQFRPCQPKDGRDA